MLLILQRLADFFMVLFHTIILEVIKMARVKYTDSDVALMARMMRAEAEGEGKQGMLMVGNVIVNRLKANCLDFKDLRTVPHVIFQVQGGNFSFEAVQKGNVFYQRARSGEKRLAKQTLDYWREHPSKYALWYFNPYAPCPPTWYNQPIAGQYKQHCYYEPQANTCEGAYTW
jgi:N-acetylmuramoyl-L-alanine amidase